MSFLESNTVIKFADFLITYYRQNKILDILRTITGSELFAGIKCWVARQENKGKLK